jgi:hypothetical protein
LLALAGIAMLLAATEAAYRPPAPLATSAPLSSFSAYRAKAILQDLIGDGAPHPIGSAADARIREAVVRRLSALGYAAELQTGFVCSDDGVCGSPVNIVAPLGLKSADGETQRDAVLLVAHYDSVAAGPGASDDGAGVAAVLEIARILAARPAPRHPIVLLLTDGEEAGLLGASLFVRDHPLSKHVRAAVNLEARGTSGLSLMFETGNANSWLMRLYGSAIARPVTNSLYYVVYKLLPNDTDFTVFKAAGYQGFNFAFIGNAGRYHTPLDNAANVSTSSLQHQGENALATLTALANSPALETPIAESAFFDVFARTLVAWPAEFTLPAALFFLTLLVAEAAILLRARAVFWPAILWGWAGVLCSLLLSTALCAGLLALLIAAGRVPPIAGASWISQPLPMHIAAAAIALLCAGGAAARLAKRAGFWGFWIAATLLVALLCVACAAVAPGASFALMLATMAAAVGALPVMLQWMKSRAPAGWATDFAALLPALVMFAAVFPLVRFLYTALGSPAWPLSTLILGLVTINLLALLAIATRRARRRVMVLAALLAVAGWVVTFNLPTYSPEWPQRINVESWFDADTGRSHYLVQSDSMRLPASLAAAAQFERMPRPRFDGSGSMAFYAAAPTRALDAPELTTLSQRSSHFDLKLRSARGAPEALVVFPANARVAEVEFTTPAGPVHAKLGKLTSGATLLDIVGLPAAGVQFGLDLAGSLPVSVQVIDQSYGSSESRALQVARPLNATSSQDGDITVVHRTVSLSPAGR